MKRLLFISIATLLLSGCHILTPEQNDTLFKAGLNTALRVAEKITK